MDSEWRRVDKEYIYCFVNMYGDVRLRDGTDCEPYPRRDGTRMVDIWKGNSVWDTVEKRSVPRLEPTPVWQIMRTGWFIRWPPGVLPVYLDGDRWNCTAANLSIWDDSRDAPVIVKTDGYYFIPDRRLRGSCEIAETGEVFSSPTELARAIGGTKSGVSFVLSGRLKTHKGLHFRWI